jgi:hypothetical protein
VTTLSPDAWIRDLATEAPFAAFSRSIATFAGGDIDNALDRRLRRLETLLAGQREVLDGQAARLEETYGLLVSLVSVLMKPEPEGPALADLLTELIALMRRNNALVGQTLDTVQRLDDDHGGG